MIASSKIGTAALLMRFARAFGVFTFGFISLATAAFAGEERGSVYAIGGVTVSQQSGVTGESPVTYLTAPGGTTLGWLVGGGVFVTTSLAIEIEGSSTGAMTAREPSRYAMTFNEERRDRFISLSALFSLPVGSSIRVEPVAGMALTFAAGWSQTEYGSFTSPQTITFGPRIEHDLDPHWGPLVGCDVRIGSRRVAVVPSFRIVRTSVAHGSYDGSSAPREIEAIYPGGYPDWTMRSAVALRVDF